MKPIVWMSSSLPRVLRDRFAGNAVQVDSAEQFVQAPRDATTLSFIDLGTLTQLDDYAMKREEPAERRKLLSAVSIAPVIALTELPLAGVVGWLRPRPWLSHIVSTAMLEGKHARARVDELFAIGEHREPRDWLKPNHGRRVRITHASRRDQRLERMTQFFREARVDARLIDVLRDTTNELLVNAFYNAPVAAGVMPTRIELSRDVALPDEFAVDIAYGLHEDLAIVRVRDPFGALSRERLVEVLMRRAQGGRSTPVQTETSEAGLWRVFGNAAIVAMSVAANHHTQVLVGIPVHGGAAGYALHLFFKPGAKRGLWKVLDEETGSPTVNTSVTLTIVE